MDIREAKYMLATDFDGRSAGVFAQMRYIMSSSAA